MGRPVNIDLEDLRRIAQIDALTDEIDRLLGVIDDVKALCDVSDWLSAEDWYWYGEWVAGRQSHHIAHTGPHLDRKSVLLVRQALAVQTLDR